MSDIIVCLVGIPDAALHEKIAEMLRMHQIQTTNDIKKATAIVHIPNEAPEMTIEEMAQKLIEQTQPKIYELIDRIKIPEIITMPETRTNTRKKSYIQINKKYKQIKQTYKQKIFNRTRHK